MFKKKLTDRTKEYWQNAANRDKVMDYICTGYDEKEFQTSKDSIVFHSKMQITDQMTVLDLACGIGRLCRFISPLTKKYIGVDFIPEMIEKAREYNKEFSNAQFYINDGSTLKMIEDSSIDIAFCELAFQHMLKPIQKSYINEIH